MNPYLTKGEWVELEAPSQRRNLGPERGGSTVHVQLCISAAIFAQAVDSVLKRGGDEERSVSVAARS